MKDKLIKNNEYHIDAPQSIHVKGMKSISCNEFSLIVFDKDNYSFTSKVNSESYNNKIKELSFKVINTINELENFKELFGFAIPKDSVKQLSLNDHYYYKIINIKDLLYLIKKSGELHFWELDCLENYFLDIEKEKNQFNYKNLIIKTCEIIKEYGNDGFGSEHFTLNLNKLLIISRSLKLIIPESRLLRDIEENI